MKLEQLISDLTDYKNIYGNLECIVTYDSGFATTDIEDISYDASKNTIVIDCS